MVPVRVIMLTNIVYMIKIETTPIVLLMQIRNSYSIEHVIYL